MLEYENYFNHYFKFRTYIQHTESSAVVKQRRIDK
jgi:hypothetical protein